MNLTRAEAAQRAETVEVSTYDIALTLDPGADTFRTITQVKFTAVPGSNTFIDAVTSRVHSVVLNGTELDPTVVADDYRIALDGLAAENELVVDADFHFMNTGEGLHKFVDPADGEVYLYSQFEVADARRMFAVFEQPDLKATFSFTVTAPSAWQVVSNSPTPSPESAPSARKSPSMSVWRFAPTPRISCYITALVAGPYEAVHSELTSSDGRTIPLGVFARRSLAEYLDAENVFDVTRRGFEFYERNFGVAYPFEKYDQLFVPEFNAGAMENAGAVTFVENYVFRSKVADATVERRAVTILHELAHMWFGDLVTMKWWNDLWLNESFAEYISTLATSEATEWTTAWTTFAAMEKSWAYSQDQLPSTHPIVADINDLEDVEVNFDGITYAKGASVLKQLVAWVGQRQFFDGVRAYFTRHAWSNTRLADLLAELEATSGRNLDSWSTVWLQEAGITVLRPEIDTGSDGVITDFRIAQETPELPLGGTPSLRPHRLAVGFYDLDGERLVRTDRFELDVNGSSTRVDDAIGRKRPALVLVNDDDLTYAKVRLDPASAQAATEHLGKFTDSLPRTLVWSAAWEMTRDAETRASTYIDLVLANIAAETDSSVVMVLLRQLETAGDLYSAAPETAAATIASGLRELARNAKPGSDAQLQFVKAFARQATTGEQLDTVAALLSGGEILDGLELDTDLQWDLLTSLVAGGRAADAEIDAQLASDNTATGHRAAARARAARPDEASKSDAWQQVVESADLPNAVLSSVVAGFGRAHDPALLEKFREKYFAALRTVWSTRTNEIAQTIVAGLYPSRLVDQTTIDETTDWLDANADAPSGLRRLVAENRDRVGRALRARQFDQA
ncbi:aminopeptidase N [Spelaeicoccus albus]|uniref:Aminopeptidase N n=1 Tax=Spelaeicoccus albus TaxID=1280376 RepID=A0A7Z0IJ08_9MICO|nr:aminopeptidase N [Spelaeicoccus albus]NYI68931.1 aminopeptidase N [Spelaeicoccus albus]